MGHGSCKWLDCSMVFILFSITPHIPNSTISEHHFFHAVIEYLSSRSLPDQRVVADVPELHGDVVDGPEDGSRSRLLLPGR